MTVIDADVVERLIKALVAYKERHRFCSHVPVVNRCHLDQENPELLINLIHAIHWFPEPVPQDWAVRQAQGSVSESTLDLIRVATSGTGAREFSVPLEDDE